MLRLQLFHPIALLLLAFLAQPDGRADAQEVGTLLPQTETIDLFNGKDFAGWIFYSGQGKQANRDDVWKIEDGILKCSGSPAGYLQTKHWYRDYQLELKWRWPGKKGGNSGVLVHTTTPQIFHTWPRSMEVQLKSGAAGDFWVIGNDVDIRVTNEDERRAKPVEGDFHTHRRVQRLEGQFEKAIGQWNTMKVICSGRRVSVFINGQLANEGTDSSVTQGAIALQSEGTPIEFKEVRLSPLENSGGE